MTQQEDKSILRTAKTVDEAIELAVLELGVGRDEVAVDVVSKGRSGILGIGSEEAKVRVTPLGGAGAGAGAGLGVVKRILEFLNVDARPTIHSSGSGPDDPPVIDVQGEDAGLIIGRRGDTLRALQFITNIVLGRREEQPTHVIVDVEQYRERHFARLSTLANRTAERAIADGRAVTLEPMSAADRRMIHVTLADNKGVTTESSGEGSERRVTIEPTGEVRPSSSGPRRGGGRGRRPAARRPEDDQPRSEDEPQPEEDEPQPQDEPQPAHDEPQARSAEIDEDEDGTQSGNAGPQPGNIAAPVEPDELEDDDEGPQPGNIAAPVEPDEFEDDDEGPQPGNR